MTGRFPRGAPTTGPRLRAVLAVAASLALSSAPACRYGDMNAVGALGPAPFDGLECFEPDNPEGFSFEVPECDCSAGMRLRYFARLEPQPADVHFEFETGYRDDDPTDDVRAVSRSRERVERLYVGGRELPPAEAATGLDRLYWDVAEESFSSMMRNYEPILRRAFRTCAEDRLARRTYDLRHGSFPRSATASAP